MLLQFDPLREFDRVASQLWGDGRATTTAMPMDAYRVDDDLFIDLDLPGVDPESIELTVENDELVVSAHRDVRHLDADRRVITERGHGALARRIFLGDALDTDGLEANYEHGVLHIRIPVRESAKRRRIPVAIGGGQRAITAGDAA